MNITDSSSFNHVTDSETLNSLVLGDTAVTVDTTDKLGVSTSVLVTSVISSLGGLQIELWFRKTRTEQKENSRCAFIKRNNGRNEV